MALLLPELPSAHARPHQQPFFAASSIISAWSCSPIIPHPLFPGPPTSSSSSGATKSVNHQHHIYCRGYVQVFPVDYNYPHM